MKMYSSSLALTLLLAAPLAAQQTTSERTGGRETSSWADVTSFLDSLERRGSTFRFGTLGTSTEGRSIPFVIAGAPGVGSAVEHQSAAHASGHHHGQQKARTASGAAPVLAQGHTYAVAA